MSFDLTWMRPEAPYMPIATVGLLAALEDAGVPGSALWRDTKHGERLHLETDRTPEQIAEAIITAPWPRPDLIPWRGPLGQAIKPILAAATKRAESGNPVADLQQLRRDVDDPTTTDPSGQPINASTRVANGRLLRALVTDAALDNAGVPSRSRLLRGVKADLSGVTEKVPLKVPALATELTKGPVWRNGKSGRGLGLVPEVQTFGGTTGRTPSDVGSHSVLLYRLLWLGILALPPVAVVRRGHRVVGGPLVTDLEVLSWPTWSFRADLTCLRQLLSLAQIHAEEPDTETLAARGITGVYRAPSVPINNMVAVFRWGERVA